ncbi:MAG: LPS export ABC transporter periplasmic protein LptC [Bdellovibrionales bacterium]|nr:LPS export ABC transporter periplasmic protein LptC [Bdellovibrionales bacterium]
MRNRLVQIALSMALLVLLVQVVLVAPSRIRDARVEEAAAILPTPSVTTSPAAPGTSDVDQVMDGMHMTGTQEGAKEWELWSDKAMSFKARETWELETVKAVFFSDSGVTFTVTGKKGKVQTKSKNLVVEGDTVTRSSNGYVFRTASMEYNSATKRLNAPARVDMTGPKDEQGNSLRLTGASMEASLLDSTMEVKRDVKAEKTLDRGRHAFIRSQRATFSGKDRAAKFFGDVVLDVDSMRITGPAANFEYAAGSDTVKSVLFTGGARVSDADKWATAQNVKVDFDANRFVFRGNPRVVQNNDELRGEEIVFLDGGKRVQVKGARAKVDEKRLENSN